MASSEMKVLEIGMSWSAERPGGANRYFEDMLRHFSGKDLRTHALVCASGEGGRVGETEVGFIAPQKAPLLHRVGASDRRIREELATFRPDLLASHFPLYAIPLLWRGRGLPFVNHFHGPWALESLAEGASPLKASALKLVEKRLYARADRFIVLTRAFGRILEETYGVPGEKIRVIPPGFDQARFTLGSETRAEARAKLGWPADRPILLAVRRLARRMGLHHLVAAMSEVKKKHPDLLVLIAGRGQMQAELQKMIDERGLGDSVRLIGFLADELLPSAYRAADATILPSESLEGFGLSAAESLGCGTPCLVTRVGGLPEVVSDLSETLIIEKSDPAPIATALLGWQGGTLRLPSSRECAEYARRKFDWDAATRAIRAVYAECL